MLHSNSNKLTDEYSSLHQAQQAMNKIYDDAKLKCNLDKKKKEEKNNDNNSDDKKDDDTDNNNKSSNDGGDNNNNNNKGEDDKVNSDIGSLSSDCSIPNGNNNSNNSSNLSLPILSK